MVSKTERFLTQKKLLRKQNYSLNQLTCHAKTYYNNKINHHMLKQ